MDCVRFEGVSSLVRLGIDVFDSRIAWDGVWVCQVELLDGEFTANLELTAYV